MTDILLSGVGGGITDGTSGGVVGSHLDERVVAQAALDASEEQLQSLCASHAGTFVSVERRGRSTEQALKDLQDAIKRVEEKSVVAHQALEQDDDKQTSLSVLSEKHRVRRRTLLQHSSLLELLELPSLMDACVRSNLYDEALSIAAFANTLERRHSNTGGSGIGDTGAGDQSVSVSTTNTTAVGVVGRVIAQIRSRQADLRRHLLHRLKSAVTMPQCLEVVTALRRLNSIDLERQSLEANLERVHAAMELRLQVDFLEARDSWLDSSSSSAAGAATGGFSFSSALAPSSSSSGAGKSSLMMNASTGVASEELLDLIERYRTRVFEVATQFNAIFRAQTNALESTVSLLSMWTARRVDTFLGLLSLQIGPMEDSASLRDALEASIFFASSMGRLGADFTAQLPPIFEPRMHALVVAHWKEGAQHLAEILKVCREAGVASPLTSQAGAVTTTETVEQHRTAASVDGAGGDHSSDGGGPQAPPRQLMSVPPLARFVNSILSGLNELRRCLLPGIFSQLRKSLEEVLATSKADLETNERTVQAPGFRGQAAELRDAAKQLLDIFGTIVEPYVLGSLEAAIGNTDRSQHFHQILRDNERGPVAEAEDNEDGNEEDGQEEDSANVEQVAEAEEVPASESQSLTEGGSPAKDPPS